MERYDLLVLPDGGGAAVPGGAAISDGARTASALENYTQWFFLTYAISVTGLPVISVPAGFTRDGLPVGIQIVGRRRQEAAVLAAAAAFEAAAPWADRIPPVVAGAARGVSGFGFRILTANLANGAGRRQCVRGSGRGGSEPDVVAVQELAPDQAEALARVLPFGKLEPARTITTAWGSRSVRRGACGGSGCPIARRSWPSWPGPRTTSPSRC